MANNFDAPWLHLTPNEEILWAGHPSAYKLAPALAVGVGLFLAGVAVWAAGVLGSASWLGLLLVPVGLAVAVPVYLRWRSQWFVLTTEEVYHKTGLVSQNVTQIRLDRVQNTTCSQSMTERMFDYGDLTIYTSGSGTADMVFEDVSDPQSVNGLLTEQLNRVSPQR